MPMSLFIFRISADRLPQMLIWVVAEYMRIGKSKQTSLSLSKQDPMEVITQL